MALATGTRVGPYEVVGPLGAGGMGEVYRARDPRLNRDVAIKILPSSFADDPGRMTRFEREAQVLAALNHPNIAMIFGIEDGALVMELVEGATLAERIGTGPIPLDEALGFARQIADALEAAHEKGIVHRDLKPANIKITPDGKVKVLDFGLAKAFASEPAGDGDPSNSPTLTLQASTGLILGTAGYMSPEQARGKPIDKRADIWAFGVVLFEMLTGRYTFQGETVSDTLAAVLKSDPDWKALPAGTPSNIRRLLRRCLERDPKRRLRDIGDAWMEMDAAEEPSPYRKATGWRWLPWAAAALFGAGMVWGWLPAPPSPPRNVTRWKAALTGATNGPSVSLSRDGVRLAYVQGFRSESRIFVREMNQIEGKPITGTEGGRSPYFSPDGQWIVFTSGPPFQSKLKKVPVAGGTPITLCDGNITYGASWGDDDHIVITAGATSGLMRVPAAGGTPQTITTLDAQRGEVSHRWPQVLPGAAAVLFTIGTRANYDTAQIAVRNLKTGEQRVLVTGGSAGRYVPTGHLVYARGGSLFAVPFDAKRLAVSGSETPVVEEVAAQRTLGGSADYTFSDSGLLLYVVGGKGMIDTVVEWVDRHGAPQPISAPARPYSTLGLSPDGERIAFMIQEQDQDQVAGNIWVYELARGNMTTVTFDGEARGTPVWTPDSKRLTFAHRTKPDIYWVAADGTGKPELLVASDENALPSSWTPNGKTLLYSLGPLGRRQIWMFSPLVRGGDGKPRLFPTDRDANDAQVSPDGQWMAFESSESGRTGVFVQPYSGIGKWRISESGTTPRWSRNGRELFYRQARRLFAVDVQPSPTFRAGNPRFLFQQATLGISGWDIAPDGKRFLMLRQSDAAQSGATLEAVVEWFEELRRRAPVKQ